MDECIPMSSNNNKSLQIQANSTLSFSDHINYSGVIVLSISKEINIFYKAKSGLNESSEPCLKIKTEEKRTISIDSDRHSKIADIFSENLIPDCEELLSKTASRLEQNPDLYTIEDHCIYWNNLGCILIRKGEYDKAMESLEKAYTQVTTHLDKTSLYPLLFLNNILCLHIIQERFYKIKERAEDFQINLFFEKVSQREIEQHEKFWSCLYENYSDICFILSGYSQASYYLDECKGGYEKVLSIQEALSPKNVLHIAKLYMAIGLVYEEKTEYEKALDYFRNALDMRKDVLRGPHIDITNSLSQLGRCYRALWDYGTALKFETEAFEMRSQLFQDAKQNEKNIFLAESFQGMGKIYYHNSEYVKAMDYFNRAMNIAKKALGEQSILLASLYKDISFVCLSQHNYEQAYKYLKDGMDIYIQAYGEENFKKATFLGYLGIYYRETENYTKSQSYFEERAEMVEKIFGVNDPKMSDAYQDIALTLQDQYLSQEAIKMSKKALKIRKLFYGEDSQFVANTLADIGSVNYNMKEFNKAVKYYERALKIFQTRLGEHPKVAFILDCQAKCLSKKGKYDQGLEAHLQALQMRKKIYGDTHISIAKSYKTIGSFYTEKQEHKMALTYYLDALHIYEQHLGFEHGEIANIYICLGCNYRNQEMFTQALIYFKKALAIREKLYGPTSLSVASCHYLIGSNYQESLQYQEAIKTFKLSLKLHIDLFGENHSEVADVYEAIGNVYYSLSEFELSTENHLKALEIRTGLFGESSVIVADSLYNIGRIYHQSGNSKSSIKYYTRALKLYKKLLGEEHTEVASVYEAIGISYYRDEKYDFAIEFFNKSLKNKRKALGKNHLLVAQTYHYLGVSNFYKENYRGSLTAYFESLKIYKNISEIMSTKASEVYEKVGKVYTVIGDLKAAQANYSKAHTIRKSKPTLEPHHQDRIKAAQVGLEKKTDVFWLNYDNLE